MGWGVGVVRGNLVLHVPGTQKYLKLILFGSRTVNKKRNITNTDKQHSCYSSSSSDSSSTATTTTHSKCRYAPMLSERAELWLQVTRCTPWGPSANLALIVSRMAPLPGIC